MVPKTEYSKASLRAVLLGYLLASAWAAKSGFWLDRMKVAQLVANSESTMVSTMASS
jgi:ABC-type nitrate/sulfonate/bicarbonate transport system permease component